MRSNDVQPQLVLDFVRRNAASSAAGATPRDAWRNYLQSQVGASGMISGLEARWLRSNGGTGNTLTDLWDSYLNSQGYTGELSQKIRQYFKSGSAAFSPTQISGLQLWLKADTGTISDGARQFTAASSEYLTIADSASVSTGDIDFTLACWVYLDTTATARHFMGKWAAAGTGATLEYTLQYSSALNRFQFRVGDGSSVGAATADNLGAPSTATWYYVVGWHDSVANTINIQVNDGTANSTSWTTGVLDGTANFSIGRPGDFNGEYMNGRIDSAGFWKRTLTTAEKTWLYNAGSGRTYAALGVAGDNGSALKTSLTSWWNLSEPSGNAVDAHGSNNLTDTNTVTAAAGIAAGSPSDGDVVSTWQDQSGNSKNATQTTASKKPLYKTGIQNSLPAILPDGVDDFMAFTDIVLSGDFTVFFVGTRGTNNDGVVLGDSSSINYISYYDSTQLKISNYNGAGITSAVAYATNTWGQWDNQRSGSTVKIFRDGSQIGTDLSWNSNSITVGNLMSRNGGSSLFWDKYFGELLVYNTVLSAANMTLVRNYLKAKWGTP